MDLRWSAEGSEKRFSAYVARLSRALGHADRVGPFRSYCTGLLLPGERKSVEPMAARLRPDRTAAEHQSLLHFIGQSPWDETALLRAVCEAVLPAMTAAGPVEGWIVDDTGFPKKGRHSVGVARQYCGQLGKQDNCQVAVSLSVATAIASLPVAWRLYLPVSWAGDAARRSRVGVPEDVVFRSKPQIALSQMATALAEGVPPGPVLADAAYGNDSGFRHGIRELGLDYVVGVLATTAVWPPGMEPAVPAWSGRGRRPTRLRRGGDAAPVLQVRALAEQLVSDAWQRVAWREGTAEILRSRFAALRIRPAHGDARRSVPQPEEWLLSEWPDGEAQPTRFWLSTLPADTPIDRLVYLAKLRWLIERDYLELKQEIGLGTTRGAAGAAFIIMRPCASPPTDSWWQSGPRFPPRPAPPAGWSRRLAFPIVIDPAAPPLRTERHVPTSIATLRRRIAHALAPTVPRCPCCAQTIPPHPPSSQRL